MKKRLLRAYLGGCYDEHDRFEMRTVQIRGLLNSRGARHTNNEDNVAALTGASWESLMSGLGDLALFSQAEVA